MKLEDAEKSPVPWQEIRHEPEIDGPLLDALQALDWVTQVCRSEFEKGNKETKLYFRFSEPGGDSIHFFFNSHRL